MQLGKNDESYVEAPNQLITITHLPQIAAKR